MTLSVNDEFKVICRQIEVENFSVEDWRDAESSDEFQGEHFCGGYDADEKEWWFQLTLDEVQNILRGELTNFETRAA